MAVLKDMLMGFKFSLRLEKIHAKIFPKKRIKRQHQELPCIEFNLEMLAVIAQVHSLNLVAKVLLKEIRLIDYFKREDQRNFNSRQVNNISRNMPEENGRNHTHSQVRGTLGYHTPDRNADVRISDVIFGGRA
jgi:hypothetical protein